MKFNKKTICRMVAELLAAAIVQFVGCTGMYRNDLFQSSNLTRGLSWGLAVLMATEAFLFVSGAHINPCITMAAMILQVIDIPMGLIYVLCQFFGTFMGYAIVMVATPVVEEAYCCTYPGDGIVPWKAALVEFYLTSSWVLVMCSSWNPKNESNLESFSLRIGLTVACLNIVGAYFSGASMNPFRSLAPALIMNFYTDIWIYMLVPPITALSIAVIWRFLFIGKSKETVEEERIA